jgi:hypothetical protein
MTSTRIWQLVSATGTLTECRLDRIDEGSHQLTILHNGSPAACETYDSKVQAQSRAWELNRGLVAHGWSDAPEPVAATSALTP